MAALPAAIVPVAVPQRCGPFAATSTLVQPASITYAITATSSRFDPPQQDKKKPPASRRALDLSPMPDA
jgi:hypothetical protein